MIKMWKSVFVWASIDIILERKQGPEFEGKNIIPHKSYRQWSTYDGPKEVNFKENIQ